MEDFNNKSAEPRKIQKVVNGTAKTKKKSDIRKAADSFISEDAKNIKSYIVMDVLLPAAKKALCDIVTDGINMLLWGKTGARSSSHGPQVDKVSWVDYSGRSKRPAEQPQSRTRFDFDEIVFARRAEAEAVLDQMVEVIGKYGYVTVADMYDMADLTQPFTSNKYGWLSLASAEVIPTRTGGYVIRLPRAQVID